MNNLLGQLTGKVFLVIAFCMCLFQIGYSQESEHYEGMTIIRADYEKVFFPSEITAIYFDTIPCEGCKDSLPGWRFIDDLKIDSLVRNDSVIELTAQSQLDSIVLNSTQLTNIFNECKTFKLSRLIKKAVPYDTIRWSKFKKENVVVHDMSKSFMIEFSKALDVDSIVHELQNTEELIHAYPVVILSPPDGAPCIPQLDSWTPNDSLAFWSAQFPDTSWHLMERYYPGPGEDGQWGVNMQCAWSALKEICSSREDAVVAILDYGVNANHPDLQANRWTGAQVLGDTTYHASNYHGTLSAGVLVAEVDNISGGAGVAINTKYIPYNITETPTNYLDDAYDACLHNVDVMAMYVSDDSPMEDLRLILETYKNIGGIFLCSVKNTAEEKLFYPAAYDDLAIAVTRYSTSGTWYSTPIGDYLDVSAPGELITTTNFFLDYLGEEVYTYYEGYKGSCPATSIVAGIVCLAKVYDVNDNLDRDIVEQILKETAYNDGTLDTTKFGAGYVDAYEFITEIINYDAQDVREELDSVPYLIITNEDLSESCQDLPEKKTKLGTMTRVLEVEDIVTEFPGEDTQAKIRSCIKDYYDEHHLEYVLLVGDGNIIPFRYVRNSISGPQGLNFISDYYYACLDGNWNYDYDTIYGEVEDSVDLDPEICIGRLPASDTLDVQNYLLKLENYNNSASNDWQNKALLQGSQILQYHDGKRICQDLKLEFPGSYQFI
jgi:hypothetical protein